MMSVRGTITEYKSPDQVATLDKTDAQVRAMNDQAKRTRLLIQRDEITRELVALGQTI